MRLATAKDEIILARLPREDTASYLVITALARVTKLVT